MVVVGLSYKLLVLSDPVLQFVFALVGMLKCIFEFPILDGGGGTLTSESLGKSLVIRFLLLKSLDVSVKGRFRL